MGFKKLASAIAAVLVLAVVGMYWWVQPERQVRRAQGRLFSALESRDFEAMAGLIAGDYVDRWQHDKAFVVRECQTVFGQFLTLSIERSDPRAEMGAGFWNVRERVKLKGFGGPLAMFARDEINALREPFTMTWRKRGWMFSDWELTSVNHPDLTLPR